MHVLSKLESQNYLSLGVEFAFLLLLAVTIVCVCVYALRSIPHTVKDQLDVPAESEVVPRRRSGEPHVGEEEETFVQPPPMRRRVSSSRKTWALL